MAPMYHVWFSTKGRKLALEGDLGEYAKGAIRDIAKRRGIRLLEAEVHLDHAHLLLELMPDQSLASITHQIKGASARVMFLQFPDLRIDMRSASFWQKSYGSRSVLPSEEDAVRKYILTQSERPYRRNLNERSDQGLNPREHSNL
jgi:putative transposase